MRFQRSLVTFCSSLAVVGVVAGLVAANAAAWGDEPAAEAAPVPSHAWPAVWPKASGMSERIEASLEEPVTLDVLEMPLREVLEVLAKSHQIPIRIDAAAMALAGVSDDMPLSHRFAEIPLSSALAILLEDLGLTYTIDSDVLLITTPEGASRRGYVKVYDVSLLLRPTESADQLATMLVATTETKRQIYPPPPEPAPGQAREQRRVTPYQQLLLVRDTTPGHREVARILRSLGEAFAAQNERLDASESEVEEQPGPQVSPPPPPAGAAEGEAAPQ